MLLSLTLSNPVSLVISIIILLVFISDVLAGYKKGFLESGVRFLKSTMAILIAYFCKSPLSRYLYLNYPFFKLGGIFKGVSSVNILLYEIIAFIAVYIIVLVILNIVSNIFGLEQKILRIVSIVGVPNKIMGAIVNGLKSIIFIYFAVSIFFVVSSFLKLDTGESLGDYVVEMPVLKNTFGSILDSFDQITELAVTYENIQDKQQLNSEAIDILLKYDIISEENLNLLIESGKIDYNINNINE